MQPRALAQSVKNAEEPENCADTLQKTTSHFTAHGSSLVQAHEQAIQWIGQKVKAQASSPAYMDAFWVLMLISLAAVPLALTLRKVQLGGAVHVGH